MSDSHILFMGIGCKNKCESGKFQAMRNIPVGVAYEVANRCTECSEPKDHFWYLKWVVKCPCCGTTLRRKPRKNAGRMKFFRKKNLPEPIKLN